MKTHDGCAKADCFFLKAGKKIRHLIQTGGVLLLLEYSVKNRVPSPFHCISALEHSAHSLR